MKEEILKQIQEDTAKSIAQEEVDTFWQNTKVSSQSLFTY